MTDGTEYPIITDGACKDVDTDVFFDRARVEEALAVCNSGCPHKGECRTRAVQRGERYGVWGGINFGSPEDALRTTYRARNLVECVWCGKAFLRDRRYTDPAFCTARCKRATEAEQKARAV